MSEPLYDAELGHETWSRALRTIRLGRGLRSRDVAQAMGMPLRSYQAFEAGDGPFTLERVAKFAAATDCDAFALLICAYLGSAEVAIACAGNKLVTLLSLGVLDLVRDGGDVVATAAPGAVISVFDAAFGRLAAEARRIADAQAAGTAATAETPAGIDLTQRQIECLQWAQAGKSSRDIGLILGVSPRTIDEHLQIACERLGVRTRIQAVSAAIDLGILQP